MKKCICGSDKYGKVFSPMSNWGPLKIAVCSGCGLARDINDYDYAALYSDKADIYKAPTDAEFEAKVSGTKAYCDFIKSVISIPGRCLDIGCNSGYLIKNLKDSGWDVTGLDLNPAVTKFALNKGLNVLNQTLKSADFEQQSFDLVLLVHTLEHLPDASEYLKTINRLVVPGGYFFVAVPNYGSHAHRLLNPKFPYCYIPGQHIWYFKKQTLETTLRSFGFKKTLLRTLGTGDADTKRRFPFAPLAKKLVVRMIRRMDMGFEIVGIFQKMIPEAK